MAARVTRRVTPTLDVEGELWGRGHLTVAGMDEVGRGAWAGPIAVGIAVVAADCPPVPEGLADSKFLSEAQRERMVPVVRGWVRHWAVGEASAEEIDELGVTAALRKAGWRALAALPEHPGVIILDGAHDYLSDPMEETLFCPERSIPPVRTEVKGDARCAVVAAASILAKSHRDLHMAALAADHPQYGWERNAGYGGAAEHVDGVAAHGLSVHHRRSWRVAAGTTGA
ncbi:ribonuclease HII [Dactylosporangium sp. NPDC000521]|uniref:ribonuclease HII n=1 Tax=Dactylosporangium sp. NPDC000521 TaxID=3363975 RepID=UPI00367E5566